MYGVGCVHVRALDVCLAGTYKVPPHVRFCLPLLGPTGRGPSSKLGEGALAQYTQQVGQCHPRGVTTGGGGTDTHVLFIMNGCQVVLRTPALPGQSSALDLSEYN